MDGFEPIRTAAARLHEVIVAAGCDSLAPSALALAAIDHLDLELAYLPVADPALKGARALFDEQSGTICCEASGDAAARALLLAHEIGHVEIHAGSATCRAGDIDPSRSTEVAPVGLQRVEDYGARERRELQADVFAREFLLPRALAERLHRVGDGKRRVTKTPSALSCSTRRQSRRSRCRLYRAESGSSSIGKGSARAWLGGPRRTARRVG